LTGTGRKKILKSICNGMESEDFSYSIKKIRLWHNGRIEAKVRS
jgi:hypothetical protein